MKGGTKSAFFFLTQTVTAKIGRGQSREPIHSQLQTRVHSSGVAGAFVGYHIAELLALGGGVVTSVIAAVVGAAAVLFAWRMVK